MGGAPRHDRAPRPRQGPHRHRAGAADGRRPEAGPLDPGRRRRSARPRHSPRSAPSASPISPSIPVIDAWWDEQWIRVLHGPGAQHRSSSPRAARSRCWPSTGRAPGVTITGVRWPLERADLAPLVGVGVSNVAIDELVTVRVSTGVLTIVMPGHRANEQGRVVNRRRARSAWRWRRSLRCFAAACGRRRFRQGRDDGRLRLVSGRLG